jgi:hypothetical protein
MFNLTVYNNHFDVSSLLTNNTDTEIKFTLRLLNFTSNIVEADLRVDPYVSKVPLIHLAGYIKITNLTVTNTTFNSF